MQQVQFEEAVAKILSRDKRFDPQAYFFLKESLDFTLKRVTEGGGGSRHVTGKELLEGWRDLALQQFGPMAATLFKEWGVKSGSDVGAMVFLLIEEQMFGRQESDRPEDFAGIYDFEETFEVPFRPKQNRATAQQVQDEIKSDRSI